MKLTYSAPQLGPDTRLSRQQRGWLGCLVGWSLGILCLGSCQMGTDQIHAGNSEAASAAVAVRSTDPKEMTSPEVLQKPPALPDSLAPTPVPPLTGVPAELGEAISRLHATLGPEARELRPAVLAQACVGYLTLRQQGRARPGAVLAVADFDLPNTTPRLWVVDLQRQKVLHRSLVAHGRGSGYVRAQHFSGKIKSACTALGFYCTADTYEGKHGLSRRLQGLDPGQNSTAAARYVVLHGATYASPDYVARNGHLGYSRGCPALPPQQYEAIIRSLPPGHVLLLSGPGLASRWLNGPIAGRRFLAHGWQ